MLFLHPFRVLILGICLFPGLRPSGLPRAVPIYRLINIDAILAPLQGADSGDMLIPGVAPFGLTPGCTYLQIN